ncbi:fungal-specific transcription factor domain-containing protein [Xylariales sp. PMI_506]|nr:fungal-specific transcription factor domain-containing protein [Xylariales sp. PMI_506]
MAELRISLSSIPERLRSPSASAYKHSGGSGPWWCTGKPISDPGQIVDSSSSNVRWMGRTWDWRHNYMAFSECELSNELSNRSMWSWRMRWGLQTWNGSESTRKLPRQRQPESTLATTDQASSRQSPTRLCRFSFANQDRVPVMFWFTNVNAWGKFISRGLAALPCMCAAVTGRDVPCRIGLMTGMDSAIPPLEIGSFDAFQPHNSEFIGSSSGVFFVNTVFRAFARLTPVAAGDGVGGSSGGGGDVLAADPVENCVGASPIARDEEALDSFLLGQAAPPNAQESDIGPSYGIVIPGLGKLPPTQMGKELMMLYFQHWHPFFPFLHGPTFLDQIHSLYQPHGTPAGTSPRPLSRRAKLCRAVTCQCIFGIAASMQPQALPPGCRITSLSTLTSLAGVLSAGHDIASLQALLAMELYLVTVMALRAASTIHGTLIRLIYLAGLHRCPFRYVQLPKDACEIRKRVLWCTYALDRYLSLALGHPFGIYDSDIDVCVTGMAELHKPATIRGTSSRSGSAPVEDVQAHLPEGLRNSTPIDNVSIGTVHSPATIVRAETGISLTPQATMPHAPPAGSAQGVEVYVQGHLVTYYRLVGEALELFHKSLHSRAMTREKVTELTCRIHSWWNSLPVTLQDENENPSAGAKQTYVTFFAIAYNYLLILINRPFFSLPTHSMDFQSSLQSAVSASRNIISRLKHVAGDHFLRNWPGILSATWMSALILAFACLLGRYPLEKARLNLRQSIQVLQAMGSRWTSARDCARALATFLDKLEARASSSISQVYNPLNLGLQTPAAPTSMQRASGWATPTIPDESPSKRRRVLDHVTGGGGGGGSSTNEVADPRSNVLGGSAAIAAQNWVPILDYIGPDFGFDAVHPDLQEVPQSLLHGGFAYNVDDMFNDVNWDASGLSFDGVFNS